MKIFSIFLAGILSFINSFSQKDTLFIYGPGGPLAPVEECAKLFSKKTGTPVKVIAGPGAQWIDRALSNADLLFGGADYMLTDIAMQHPGFVDSSTRTELYKRAAGILVRPGNPKKIYSLKDLARPGIKLLDVNGAGQKGLWEDLAGKLNLIGPVQKNIRKSFANTAQAIEAWKTDKNYDAWIIFSSWHYRLKDVTSLVKIPPGQTVYRGTPIAVSTVTDQKEEAKKFIQFLLTNEAHAVFRKWGWE